MRRLRSLLPFMPKPSTRSPDLALLDSFWNEPLERTVLPNGLTVIVKPDASAALASVQVWVKTGSLHEGAKLGAGLSHYLEHMLFKGTTKREGREISAQVQAFGGNINAYTTFDRTVYYIDLPSEHTEAALELLSDAVFHSTLPADEVAKEKDVILREIAMTQDDPDGRHWEAVFATAFRAHPYREPIIGHKDVFSAITRDELVSYYRRRYVPNNAVVVVVGDVDPAQVRSAIETHFGAIARAALEPVLVPEEPLALAPRALHRFEDVEVSRVALSWPVPGLTHPDAPLLDLLGMVLGSGDSSLLWSEVREKAGLVHTIDASNWNPGSSGLFCVSYTCEPQKREKAALAVEKVLRACVSKGFTQADLRKALRQAVVGEINTRKTMSGQASRLGIAEVVVGDLSYSESYFERLASVKPSDLVRVLKTYLVPSRRIDVSQNPAAGLSQPTVKPRRVGRPDFQEVVLRNGARIVYQQDNRLPSVHLRLAMQGGPLWETPGKRGATSLLATLLTKDTLSRSAAEVARRIEETGGVFAPFSGNNSLGFMAEGLPNDVDRAIECISGALHEPAFKRETLEIERESQLSSLRQTEDDVVSFTRRLAREKFFGSYPLALDSEGDVAGVSALTSGDLASLYKELSVGSNVVLAAVGSFNERTLLPKLEKLLSRCRPGTLRAPLATWSGPQSPGDFVVHKPREQAVVVQAYPGSRVLEDDYYVSEVADEIFSGMASRLFERVREEKGLAYFVRSTRVTGLGAGMFAFFAGTQPGKEAQVLAEIEAEIARVQAGLVDAVELARCQVRLKAGRRQALQTNGSRAMQASLNALQGQSINDWKTYDERIDRVGVKDLARFATERFKKAYRTQLVVRPA